MTPMPEPFVDLGVALYAFLANPYSWLLYAFLGLAAINWAVRSYLAHKAGEFDRSRFLDVVPNTGIPALILLALGTLAYVVPEPARYGLILLYAAWAACFVVSEGWQLHEDIGVREKAVEPAP